MTDLASRIEQGQGDPLDLSTEVLRWFESAGGFGYTERLRQHFYGLVGDLTGVERLAEDLWPGCIVHLGRKVHGGPCDAAILPRGAPTPYSGYSPVKADALLAAVVRAAQTEVRLTGGQPSWIFPSHERRAA